MMKEKAKQYQYYILIGVISVVALLFLPMLGTDVGLAFKIPNTFAGWVVYILTKLLVAVLNILIFHCFVMQGKTNILQNEKYLEALAILQEVDEEDYSPRSPQEWHKTVYSKKGASIFLTSILSAFGLTQAMLTFDWLSMLTYLFTVLLGIIFGIFQMNSEESYWTDEFYRYAKKIERERLNNKDSESTLECPQNALESTISNEEVPQVPLEA